MNTIKCPNCRFENTFGLVFCTNCGASLYGQANEQSAPSVERSPSYPPDTLQYRAADTMTQRKSSVSKFLILGGIAAVVLLLLGVVALSSFFYYLGSRTQIAANQATANTSSSASNRDVSSANKAAANSGNSNANDTDYDDTDIQENPITLPPAVGPYEQQGIIMGSAQDFLGADEVTKATYVKKGKEVEFVLAKFSDRAAAKGGFEDFLKGFRNSGAKVVARQKVKNKAGINNGEASLFTFEKKWNALMYSDKYGVRFIAPDRYTLLEFAKEFDRIFSNK